MDANSLPGSYERVQHSVAVSSTPPDRGPRPFFLQLQMASNGQQDQHDEYKH